MRTVWKLSLSLSRLEIYIYICESLLKKKRELNQCRSFRGSRNWVRPFESDRRAVGRWPVASERDPAFVFWRHHSQKFPQLFAEIRERYEDSCRINSPFGFFPNRSLENGNVRQTETFPLLIFQKKSETWECFHSYWKRPVSTKSHQLLRNAMLSPYIVATKRMAFPNQMVEETLQDTSEKRFKIRIHPSIRHHFKNLIKKLQGSLFAVQ